MMRIGSVAMTNAWRNGTVFKTRIEQTITNTTKKTLREIKTTLRTYRVRALTNDDTRTLPLLLAFFYNFDNWWLP